jgi:3,4-dihydroxy 2-butanone 4-phosphate synthase
MALAGLKPCRLLCVLTIPDGTMGHLPKVVRFSEKHGMSVFTIEDLVDHHKRGLKKAD